MAKAYPKTLAPYWRELALTTLPTYILGVLDSAFYGRLNEGMEAMSRHQLARVKRAVGKGSVEIVLAFQGACNSHQKAEWGKKARKKRAGRK